jgi:PAS domain S-box-containing protein
MVRKARSWLRLTLLGLLAALPLGVILALLRRYIGLFLAANEYRRAVLDYAVDGIILIDDRGIIHAFNPAAEQIFGYQAKQMIGQGLQAIVAPPDHVMFKLISIGREATGIRYDGTTFAMDMTSGQMQISDRRMYILIVRDATRRKQIEDELRHARDAAEAASRAKSAFLLTMSHELRTPLNHIIGYGDIVREELAEHDLPGVLADMQKIDRAGHALLGQIDDVLEMANLESGVIQLASEQFAVRPLLEELARHVRPMAERNRNRFELEIGDIAESMVADQVRVRQMLLNVLENACKFTEQGTILLQVSKRADSEAGIAYMQFEVSDTGHGIAKEHVHKLFEPFPGVNTPAHKQSGAGLGLAITARLCRMMGGDIQVESVPGEGSVFRICLPVHARTHDINK